MLPIRIQVLVLFSCAVLLRRNHGFSLAPTLQPPHGRVSCTRLFATTTQQQTPVWKLPLTTSGSSTCQDINQDTSRILLDRASSSSHREPTPSLQLKKQSPFLPFGVAGLWTHVQTKRARLPTLHSSTVWTLVSVPSLMIATSLLLLLPSIITPWARQSMAWYLTQLDAFPLVTKSVTSGIIGLAGDFCAQLLEAKLKKNNGKTYDVRRGMAILVDGLFVSGPIMHWGYNAMERILPVGGNVAAMIHVIADSIVLDSLFVATAMIGTGLLEGYKFRKDILPQLKRDYAPTVKAGWATSVTLMPLVFVCFRFLPVTLRTVAMNLTDVVWNGIISFMAHRNRQRSNVCDGAAAVMI